MTRKVWAGLAMAIALGGGTAGVVVIAQDDPAPGTANLWMDVSGGTCTRSDPAVEYADAAACDDLDEAYTNAQCGDLVLLKEGPYGDADGVISATEKTCGAAESDWVAFREAPGEEVVFGSAGQAAGITVQQGSYMIFDGFYLSDGNEAQTGTGIYFGQYQGTSELTHHLIWENGTAETFLVRGSDQVTIRDSEFTPQNHWDEKNWVSAGDGGTPANYATDMVIENNNIHGFTEEECAPSDCHVECLTAEFENVTIRNNRFYDCDIFGIILALEFGEYATKGDNNLIENNFIHCCSIAGSSALAIGDTEPGSMVTIRFNSIQGGFSDNYGGSVADLIIHGNVMSSNGFGSCTGATRVFTYNVIASGEATSCGATNTSAATGFVDQAAFNLHLTSDAAARSFVPVANCVATDVDGDTRPVGSGTHCDAGADERD